ncbi:c-type cytochrome biogenesis protein CcmI [Shewanella sp. SM34]|uniref:c-type cytochrome biogenesis protein CcmI n=1 Tax=unclassified Shewanella TaxID=196818 RepID=UPI0021D7D52D|nr:MULTISPECIES: c-type cytochrome biogenesis protein CcmI [unclassified Shewanella]MCU8010181.1 c-type cytochrome biogenesis protein CcmI [Shewanella sp. SM87]MCU8058813.1 c-type cytochrome biogenesis protein CcmI [Shewanella sp. SM35]MCU8067744.1 c-type cytochrome biogenesis protein CcmI [Shewanella sp. SM34]MCU8076726.1 c-type cytochrome biogenesis protein CcmI [Shewanella sp. SM29]
MTTFWIFIALVMLVGLMLIWIPHFRQQKLLKTEEAGVRKQTNLELFNERLGVLEKELSEELLDQAEFDALKKELEISLLQDIKQANDDSLVNQIKPKTILWPSIMSVCLIVISGYLYQHLGAFENIDSAQQPANPHAGMDTAQIMMQRVQMMEAQVKAEPENSQLWFSLGHAYVSANQYDKAIAAFDKVIELVGKHAELLGPKATAMYYKAGQQMTPQIQALINESLAMDAQDPSTLLLVGMDAFFTADYKKAITSWQTILDSGRADVDRAALMNAIETANLRMQSETAGMPNDDAHKQVKASAKSVNVTISISAELAAKASPEDTIFIFARATEGPKVPLAATKVSARSFPITVTLDDSSGMGGDVKLSDAANVEVIAVLSKQGNIKPQTGDIQGKISKVAVGDTANLVLDTQVQ